MASQISQQRAGSTLPATPIIVVTTIATETAAPMKCGRMNSSTARRSSPDIVQRHGQVRKAPPDTQSSLSPAWKGSN